jgi:hypothetical protein
MVAEIENQGVSNHTTQLKGRLSKIGHLAGLG